MSNPFDCFNDDLNDAGPAPSLRDQLGAQREAHGFIAPADQGYTEQCGKCGGSGRFRASSGRDLGACFACKGKGTLSFKTDAATRAKGRARSAVKSAEKAAAKVAWREEHAAEIAWLRKTAEYQTRRTDGRAWDLPAELLAKIDEYGTLFEGTIAKVREWMAKDEARRTERQAAKAAEEAAAPTVDLSALHRSFDLAAKNNARCKHLTFGSFIVYPAKATSANPGALYVKAGKGRDDTYLGKIVQGRFSPSRDCTDEVKATVLELLADPSAAAVKYGKKLIHCICCGAELDNPLSRELGIGPICREKWGL
jgi:hypothetical protein